MPLKHDGPRNNHGTIAARRRANGGKNHVRYAYVQAGKTSNGGVRLFKSHRNALTR